jgi:hypothetical protein
LNTEDTEVTEELFARLCDLGALPVQSLRLTLGEISAEFSSYFVGNWLIFHLIFIFGASIMQ